MTTPADIAKWAWDDPESRVQDAISQLTALARTATGPDLREIQDTGVMLERLAGTLQPVQTISAQLAGDTISAQVIELDRHDAWMRERRGRHGEWTSVGGAPYTGTMNKARANRIRRLQDAHTRQVARQEAERVQAAAGPELSDKEIQKRLKAMPLLPGETQEQHMNPLPGETPRENLIHEQVLHQEAQPIEAARAENVMAQAKAHVAEVMAEADKQAETKEGSDAKKRLIVEGGAAIAGGVLAYLEAKFGVPDTIALTSAAIPPLIQVIIEFFKRL